MMELWPFTNFHDLNLDWIIKTIKRLDNDVQSWKIGLKEYVLELLSDHPEWIQDWMLDDGTVTWEKLAEDSKEKIVNNTLSYIPDNLENINQILELAKPYMDDHTIVYDSGKSPFYYNASSTGRGLTCSDWCMIALWGIQYDNTRWFGTNNTPGPFSNIDEGLVNLKYQGAWSEQLARYIDENNLSYIPNDDMSNVAPGDCIFYDLDPSNDNDPMYYPPTGETTTRYKGVDHCAVFVQKPNDDYYTVLEVTGNNNEGWVKLYNTGIGNRKMVTAIRNPMNATGNLPKVLYAGKPPYTSGSTSSVNMYLTETVKSGEWVHIFMDCEVNNDNYLVVDAYDGATWTRPFTQSSMMYKVFMYDNHVSILFRAQDDYEQINVTAVPITPGDPTSLVVDRCTIYNGYCAGHAPEDAQLMVNNPNYTADIDSIKIEPNPSAGAAWSAQGGLYYYKIGSRVTVHVALSGLTTSTQQTIFWLPAGYRPYAFNSVRVIGSGNTDQGVIKVNPSGSVQTYVAANTYIAGEISFDV